MSLSELGGLQALLTMYPISRKYLSRHPPIDFFTYKLYTCSTTWLYHIYPKTHTGQTLNKDETETHINRCSPRCRPLWRPLARFPRRLYPCLAYRRYPIAATHVLGLLKPPGFLRGLRSMVTVLRVEISQHVFPPLFLFPLVFSHFFSSSLCFRHSGYFPPCLWP